MWPNPPPCDGSCPGHSHATTYRWLVELLELHYDCSGPEMLEQLYSASLNSVPGVQAVRRELAQTNPPITRGMLCHFGLLRPAAGEYDMESYSGGSRTDDYYDTDSYRSGPSTTDYDTTSYYDSSATDRYGNDTYGRHPTPLDPDMESYEGGYSLDGGSQRHGGWNSGHRGYASSGGGSGYYGGQADTEGYESSDSASIRAGECHLRYADRRRHHGHGGGSSRFAEPWGHPIGEPW